MLLVSIIEDHEGSHGVVNVGVTKEAGFESLVLLNGSSTTAKGLLVEKTYRPCCVHWIDGGSKSPVYEYEKYCH